MALIHSGSCISLAAPPSPPQRLATPGEEPADLSDVRHKGNELFRSGDYLHAANVYEDGFRKAMAQNAPTSALRLLNNLGSARFKMFEYRAAIRAFLQAEQLARKVNDQSSLVAVLFNLSSLYYINGEMDSASAAATEGLALPAEAAVRFKPKLLIQAALIESTQGDFAKADAGLRESASIAHAAGDTATEAQALNELGHELVERGQPAAADETLMRAVRLRETLGGDALHYFYESLGDLRLQQGYNGCALEILGRAIHAARPFGPTASWTPIYLHGRALLSAGRLQAALSDFQSALEDVRASRAEMLPADAFRISGAASLHELYSSFIATGAQLSIETNDRRYVQRAFAVAEESRAVSLRRLWAGPDLTARLDPGYGQAVSELQQAEIAEIRNTPGAAETARRARAKVTEFELKAGLDLPSILEQAEADSPHSLRHARAALRPDEVYFGFHIDESGSGVWALTREGFDFRRLPEQYPWRAAVADFRKAIRGDLPSRSAKALELYELLFAGFGREFLGKPVWLLAPDGPLFDLPFAALTEAARDKTTSAAYLIENHAINVVPGLAALTDEARSRATGVFVALGDPIYNRADERLRHGAQAGRPPRPARQAPVMELNRLPGTAREVEACARQWRAHGSDARVMEGADASVNGLSRALKDHPAVVHIAAHVLLPAGKPVIAFSLLPQDQVELLSAPEVSGMKSDIGLVVLDGCSSGSGDIVPGAGLVGMTRAWLAAGARAVVATRWPVDDRQAGAFFHAFYEHYYEDARSGGPRIARVLQRTQVEMLRLGGAQASPSYWAAYLSVERN